MSGLCHPLLGLTDDEAVLIPPAELDRMERDALIAFKVARRYSYLQWSYLVESHNEADPEDRAKRRALCVSGKHDWRKLPMDRCLVCQRCLSYKLEQP